MKHFFKTFLFGTLLVMTLANVSAAPLISEEQPFWRTKPKVYKKILEGREIIVSVKTVDDKSVAAAPKIMQMLGGGVIAVPRKFAYDQARNFKNLEKMSDHVRKADWNAKTQMLFLHTEAFNYHAHMHMKVTLVETAEKNSIQWNIVAGTFTGMQGRIEFTQLKPEKTEIALASGYRYSKFPIPAFFLEFGLEVVMQKIAGRMRSFIEEEYKRCNKVPGVCNESKSSS